MTESEAIERARHEADARNWPWVGPVRARQVRGFLLGRTRWRVLSNANSRSFNVFVEMDDETGRVLRAHVLAS